MNPEASATVPAPSTDQTPATYKSNPFELIKPSIEAFKRCWANIILALLSMIGAVLALVLLFALANAVAGGAASTAVNVVIFLVAFPVAAYAALYFSWSITKSILAAVRGGKLSFKDSLPTKWTDPLKLFVTQLLVGIFVIIGFLLLIVPGIFAMAFWSFAPYVTVDTGEWGWAALKKSRDIMRGRTWDTLGALFVISVFGILTVIPFLGALVYVVLTIITLPLTYLRYQSLLDLKQQPDWQSVPTSKWNYAILIIGLLVGGTQTAADFDDLQKNASPVELNDKAY